MTKQLCLWFQKHQRALPWRISRTPYTVWISEIMLQQTKASVVVPYFLKWMEQFPNIQSLAASSLEKVIKVWEGLGYYTRARNLHKGARQIMEQFDGIIPNSKESLRSIDGIGAYTAGAILSFGFHQKAVAVDGNITRVVSRYFAVEKNVSEASTKKQIESHAETLLDETKPWVSLEALIELGATICQPKPFCTSCPLKKDCLAFREKKTTLLPIKNKKQSIVAIHRSAVVIEMNGFYLIGKAHTGKIMADLYEFPYWEGKHYSVEKLQRLVEKRFPLSVEYVRDFTEITHTFTRYKAHLYPSLFRVKNEVSTQPSFFNANESFDWIWALQEQLPTLPFSSGHKKIALQI